MVTRVRTPGLLLPMILHFWKCTGDILFPEQRSFWNSRNILTWTQREQMLFEKNLFGGQVLGLWDPWVFCWGSYLQWGIFRCTKLGSQSPSLWPQIFRFKPHPYLPTSWSQWLDPPLKLTATRIHMCSVEACRKQQQAAAAHRFVPKPFLFSWNVNYLAVIKKSQT